MKSHISDALVHHQQNLFYLMILAAALKALLLRLDHVARFIVNANHSTT